MEIDNIASGIIVKNQKELIDYFKTHINFYYSNQNNQIKIEKLYFNDSSISSSQLFFNFLNSNFLLIKGWIQGIRGEYFNLKQKNLIALHKSKESYLLNKFEKIKPEILELDGFTMFKMTGKEKQNYSTSYQIVLYFKYSKQLEKIIKEIICI